MPLDYKIVGTINEEHDIRLVTLTADGTPAVLKTPAVYNRVVYEDLRDNPVEGVPHIYDLWEDESGFHILEELIIGISFERFYEENGSIQRVPLADYMLQLARILKLLHKRKPPIIHRDIKPSNVMVTPSGKIYLIDFNAAKLYSAEESRDTVLLGTEGYAAPEQYGFGSSSAPTDIYAVGAMIKELAPKKDSTFSHVIKKCMDMNPKRRYRNADELIRALKDVKYLQKERPYLPPGFRHLNPAHMVAALGYYFMTAMVCYYGGLEEASTVGQVLFRIGTTLLLWGIGFFSADYLGVQRYFPLTNSTHLIFRILGIAIYDTILFVMGLLLLSLIIG